MGNAAVAVSGGADSITESVTGSNASNSTGNETTVWVETVFGAVIGVVVIGAVVLSVVQRMKRRTKIVGKQEDVEMGHTVHVVEASPSESTEATTTDAVNAESV